ncbi:MAG: hypothetical protein ACKPDI_01690 [Actinomycetota bacterium]
MKMKKIVTGFIAATLALTIGIGVTQASADGKDPSSAVPSVTGTELNVKKLCKVQTKVAIKVVQGKSWLNKELIKLTADRDKAQAKGKTKKVEVLNGKIAWVNGLIAKIDSKYAAYQAWAATNCPATPEPPSPSTSNPSTSDPSTSNPSTSVPSTSAPSTSAPTSSTTP